MKEPFWILENIVYAIHKRQIAEHGGEDGIRDEGLLVSALSRPKNSWHYENPSIFRLAANYAYGIIKNHPFVDGNKRTAYVVCRTFLKLNSYVFDATKKERYHIFISLAQGDITEEEFAVWLENNSKKSE